MDLAFVSGSTGATLPARRTLSFLVTQQWFSCTVVSGITIAVIGTRYLSPALSFGKRSCTPPREGTGAIKHRCGGRDGASSRYGNARRDIRRHYGRGSLAFFARPFENSLRGSSRPALAPLAGRRTDELQETNVCFWPGADIQVQPRPPSPSRSRTRQLWLPLGTA